MYQTGKFAGETEAKTYTRAYLYSRSILRVGLQKFQQGEHVVLGGEGGDIRTLLAVGVPPENIYVAERDYRAYRSLAIKFPKVKIWNEDVLTMMSRVSNPVSLNLDFCNKLSTRVVQIVSAALRLAGNNDLDIFVTVFGSREQDPKVRGIIKLCKAAGFEKAESRMVTLKTLLSATSSRNVMRCDTVTYTTPQNRRMVCGYFRVEPGTRTSVNNWEASQFKERDMAMCLWFLGLKSRQIAEIMCIPRQRVAAWVALRTRKRRLISELQRFSEG